MKQKRQTKTKQQLLDDKKFLDGVLRQKRYARDILYPALHEHSTSIQHAQRSCEVMKMVIMGAMQKPFKDKTVGFLDLEKELIAEKDVKDRDLFLAFINGFKDIEIGEAVKLFEGMGGAIDGYIRAESAKQSFQSIPLESLIA